LEHVVQRRGTRIEDVDAAIAAHALAVGATFVAADLDHVARIPGLRVEDWSR
jgi:predicted nucleic acid-binding protein